MLSKSLQHAACGILILCTSAPSFAGEVPGGCELQEAALAIARVMLQEGPVTPEEVAGEAALRRKLQEEAPDKLIEEIKRSAEGTVADYEASAALGEPEAPQVIAAAETRIAKFFQKYFAEKTRSWQEWASQRYGSRGGLLIFSGMIPGVAAVPARSNVGMAIGLAVAAPIFAMAELTLFFANSGRKLIFITSTALDNFVTARLAMDASQQSLQRAQDRLNNVMPQNAPWEILQATTIAQRLGEQSAFEQMKNEARQGRRFN